MKLIPVAYILILPCNPASGFFWFSNTKEEPGSPVVIIPGTGASQLEARINRQHGVAPHCNKQTDWTRLWLSVWTLLAGHMDCWSDNIKLIYDPKTGKSSNTPGVETRVPGWGTTETIEYLDPSWAVRTLGIAKYAAPLVDRLVSWGYERGKTVIGAPYDWRYAPHSQTEYFQKLKQLIEKAYHENNEKKVTVFGHSLGCIFGLYFLNEQTLEWKNKYIQSFAAAGGPWEGAAKEYQLYASGMNFGAPTVDPFVLRKEQRFQENNMLLLPRVGDEWTARDIFVFTPKRNYSAGDIHDFMVDAGFPVGNHMIKHYSNPKYALKHPGVPFHCITSKGLPTPLKFVYSRGFNEQKFPRVIKGDGDGSVSTRSLQSCLRMEIPGQFKHHQMTGVKHTEMLNNEEFFTILKGVLYD